METQTNNNNIPQNEVDEIRRQLALFKQRLDQQEIINDRLMRRSMSARLSIFTRTGLIADIICLFLMPVVFVVINRIGAPWYFAGFLLLMVIIETTFNFIVNCQLPRLFTEGNDLLTVRQGLLRFKRNERLWMLIAVPLIILWALALGWQQGLFGHELTDANAARLVRFCIALFIGLLICFGAFIWEMRRVNKAIREIDELEQM